MAHRTSVILKIMYLYYDLWKLILKIDFEIYFNYLLIFFFFF